MKDLKSIDRSNDTTATRGFSTDQRINIETVKIHRQRLTHQKDETRLVGMSIQEAAIGRQVASAEARAEKRCPTYKSTNIYWKRVDQLLEEQEKVTALMGSYNDTMMNDGDKKEIETEMKVIEVLNQPSPVKKERSKRSYEEMKDDASSNKVIVTLDDDDFEDEGLAVKLERIKEVTETGTVSTRWSKRRKSA